MSSPVDLAIRISSDASDAAADLDKVGGAALSMADDVDRASRTADAAGSRMANAADGADALGSRSSQAAGGIGDLGGALSLLPGPLGALGTGMEAAAPAIMGVTGAADLANLALDNQAVTTARAAVASARHRVVTVATTAATKAQTIAQRALNLAMRANPIGIVITAIAALVAIVVLAYKRSETFRKIVDKAFGVLKRVVLAAGKAFVAFKDAVIRRGTEAVRWVAGLPGRIVRALASLGRYLYNAGREGFTRLLDAAVNLATRVINFYYRLPGRIVRALGNLGSLLYDKGVDIVEGLWRGIQSMGSWIADKVIGFVKAVLPAPVERALGIASPSKVMARLGRFAAEGIAVGIEDRVSVVEAAARRLAAATVPPELDLADRYRRQVDKVAGVLTSARLPALTIPIAPTATPGTAPGAAVAGAGGDTITITVNGALDPVAVGRQLEQLLTASRRRNGRR